MSRDYRIGLISPQHYKTFFNEDYEENEDDDFFEVEMIFTDKNNMVYEFEVEWKCEERDENGYIENINWKSYFAFASCYWFNEEDEYDSSSDST